jgi:uncharacterized DUF497 family protein
MGVRFDWNPAKAASNIRKHGVGFPEAQTIFGDQAAVTIYDERHSTTEDRWVTIGRSALDNLLVVVHTEFEDDEGDEVWWLISARRATKREAARHGT